ncbi:MAG: 23S rRNA (uracil(1939)-C(5))-methyltransferase RlmD, partial [Candidatus Marinimicrobia bacterium]|nr:23S rRNA (uracil(1939)-C(5))-methyltransferase RlmD [Candidatus Neomarinimicrobiota bacterium]
MNSKEYPVKKNQILTLSVDSIAYGGKGVARLDGYVIFIKNAIPGQELEVKIIKRKSSYAEALILNVVKESDWTIESQCPWFADCGGCTFQNIGYENQLKIKKQQVEDVYRHLSHVGAVKILDPLPSPATQAYRNKMEFSAGDSRWLHKVDDPETAKDFAIGLHAPGRFDKILDIESCLLQDDERNEIFKFIRQWAKENNITLNNPRQHTGFLRNIMIRKGEHSGEIMVNMITRTYEKELMQHLAEDIREKFPSVTSFMNNVTASLGGHSRGEQEYCITGNAVIHDRIGDIDYEISPNSFFQTNTSGAEGLYDVVKKYAESAGSPVIWDFYSGTGSIALYLAKA